MRILRWKLRACQLHKCHMGLEVVEQAMIMLVRPSCGYPWAPEGTRKIAAMVAGINFMPMAAILRPWA